MAKRDIYANGNYITDKTEVNNILNIIYKVLPRIPAAEKRPITCLRTIRYYIETNDRFSIPQQKVIYNIQQTYGK